MYHNFLIHSSVDGHLHCFHVLAIVNSATLNFGIHVSLSIMASLGGFPDSSVGKESICNAGDSSLIPGSRRSPAERIGYPLQYSWLPLWLSWERICLQCRRSGLSPWVGKIPWKREQQPTPIFLPREFHGQRNLAGYSPWGRK